MRQKLSMLMGLVLLLAFTFLVLSYFDDKDASLISDGPVEIIFFPYETEAESILIRQGNQVILIDTGFEKEIAPLLLYFKEKKIEKIDYLLLSSPLEGNIGGTPEILKKIQVENVIMPYYAKINKKWEEVNNLIDEQKIQRIIPTRTRRWVVGRMELVVYPPLKKNYQDDRNYSLVSLVTYGQSKMLFTGNAHKKRSEELLSYQWSDIDLYKLPNYGKENSNSRLLIKEINPRTIVVTNDKMDEGIEAALVDSKIRIYHLTDEKLVLINDGKETKSIERSNDGQK